MNGSLLFLFTTYLIYPLLAMVLIGVSFFIGKKNNLLRNKRLVTYTLLSILILVSGALLGFLDYNFMPYGYMALATAYLIAGYWNYRLLLWVFNKKEVKYHIKIGYILFQLAVSVLLFTLLFNLCNELKYGLWATTTLLPFLLISLLVRSYEILIHIPSLIYKVWEYDRTSGYSAPEDIDHSKLKVVTMQVFKQEEDAEPIRINAKVPDEMLLGDWIKLLFEDYNIKSAHTPIDVYGEGGWLDLLREVLDAGSPELPGL
ncbi:MAG: TssN family type VI secretion system protein [Bacteroides sp.]|nr:TssN family type VI secretion system protein [Bacteroides sp.]